jgi:FkbM family methyltransferase
MLNKIVQHSVSLIPWRLRGVVKKIPLVAPLQRWLLAKFLEGREFVHTVDAGPARGLKYPITLPQDKLIWTGTWELDFLMVLAEAVKPGDVCYDIGGYHGFFSGVFALAQARQVYTFEPLPDNIQRIKAMISLNPALPIRLLEMAAGEQTSEAEFRILPEATMGKLAESSFQAEIRGQSAILVRMCSVDDLIEGGEILPPNVIKIDTEGAEVMVLEGAKNTLASFHPLLFVEVHSHELGRLCQDYLKQNGYAIRVLETNSAPDFKIEPEVCHYVATPN